MDAQQASANRGRSPSGRPLGWDWRSPPRRTSAIRLDCRTSVQEPVQRGARATSANASDRPDELGRPVRPRRSCCRFARVNYSRRRDQLLISSPGAECVCWHHRFGDGWRRTAACTGL